MMLVTEPNQPLRGAEPGLWNHPQLFFRELSYDASQYLRRGTCYVGHSSQPAAWRVNDEGEVLLETLNRQKIASKVSSAAISQPLVCLGAGDQFSIAHVVGIETLATGEEVLTLKSRKSFGLLPDLLKDNLSLEEMEKLQRLLFKVTESYRTTLPESVVDRCRDAASYALGLWLEAPELDLGRLVKRMANLPKEKQRNIAKSAADVVRLLHARAKPSEQANRGPLPEVMEGDGELAVTCLGSLLRELGYAEWRSY